MTTFDADSTVAYGENQNLATWNRQRTLDELRNFVNAKHALLPDTIDIE